MTTPTVRTMQVRVWLLAYEESSNPPEIFGTRWEADDRLDEICRALWDEYEEHWVAPIDWDAPDAEEQANKWWDTIVASYAPRPVPKIPDYPGTPEAARFLFGIGVRAAPGVTTTSHLVTVPMPLGIVSSFG